MWKKELGEWEKRASEINNTYNRGSDQWNAAMGYVQPRINESRRKAEGLQKQIDAIDAAARPAKFVPMGPPTPTADPPPTAPDPPDDPMKQYEQVTSSDPI